MYESIKRKISPEDVEDIMIGFEEEVLLRLTEIFIELIEEEETKSQEEINDYEISSEHEKQDENTVVTVEANSVETQYDLIISFKSYVVEVAKTEVDKQEKQGKQEFIDKMKEALEKGGDSSRQYVNEQIVLAAKEESPCLENKIVKDVLDKITKEESKRKERERKMDERKKERERKESERKKRMAERKERLKKQKNGREPIDKESEEIYIDKVYKIGGFVTAEGLTLLQPISKPQETPQKQPNPNTTKSGNRVSPKLHK